MLQIIQCLTTHVATQAQVTSNLLDALYLPSTNVAAHHSNDHREDRFNRDRDYR